MGVDPELDGWPCSCGPRGHPWTGGVADCSKSEPALLIIVASIIVVNSARC